MRKWTEILGKVINYRNTTHFSVEVGTGKSQYTVIHRSYRPDEAEYVYSLLQMDANCKKRVSMVNEEGVRQTVAFEQQPG